MLFAVAELLITLVPDCYTRPVYIRHTITQDIDDSRVVRPSLCSCTVTSVHHSSAQTDDVGRISVAGLSVKCIVSSHNIQIFHQFQRDTMGHVSSQLPEIFSHLILKWHWPSSVYSVSCWLKRPLTVASSKASIVWHLTVTYTGNNCTQRVYTTSGHIPQISVRCRKISIERFTNRSTSDVLEVSCKDIHRFQSSPKPAMSKTHLPWVSTSLNAI